MSSSLGLPGKRLRCLRSIPETAVTPSLAPGVSALRYNRRWRRTRRAERWWWWGGVHTVASADRLQHNFVQHHVSFFCPPTLPPPHTKPSGKKDGSAAAVSTPIETGRQGEDSGCSLHGQSDSLPPPHPTHPPPLPGSLSQARLMMWPGGGGAWKLV